MLLLKGLASIYHTKPNTEGRMSLVLTKEPRQKSHLIHLGFSSFFSSQLSWCAGEGSLAEALNIWKGSHY